MKMKRGDGTEGRRATEAKKDDEFVPDEGI
jgi:hypothetical protein